MAVPILWLHIRDAAQYTNRVFPFSTGMLKKRIMVRKYFSFVKQSKRGSILLLAAFVLLMQSLPLHQHVYYHAPEQSDQAYQSPVHFNGAAGQGEQRPDESVPIKTAKDGVLKNLFFMTMLGIFFSAVLVSLPVLSIFRPHITFNFRRASSFDLGLVPPLRAPPLL